MSKPNPLSTNFRLGPVLLAAAIALSASAPLLGGQVDQLYADGFRAYQANDFFGAALNLFAFKQLAPPDVTPDSWKKIDAALSYSQGQVLAAIRAKQEHDTHGTVTKVTTDSSGKADSPFASSHGVHVSAPPPHGGSPAAAHTQLTKPALPAAIERSSNVKMMKSLPTGVAPK